MSKCFVFLIILPCLLYGCNRPSSPFCIGIQDKSDPKGVVGYYDSLYNPAGTFLSRDSIPVAWYDDFRPQFEKRFADIRFQWGRETRIWLNLCCSPQGKIEHALYHSSSFASPEVEQRFSQEAENFLKGFTFRLRAQKPYSQCGTLIFKADTTK